LRFRAVESSAPLRVRPALAAFAFILASLVGLKAEQCLIITDGSVIRELISIFETDWAQTESGRKELKKAESSDKKEEKQLATAS
jgi:hypothetical protein